MGKIYDIAVIGESMAGKSTWIAGMLNEKAYEKLQSVSKNNSEGQTKIPIRYYMENSSDDKLEVHKVEWNIESLERYLSEKSHKKEIIEKLEKYFRFPNDDEDVALQEYMQEHEFCISEFDVTDFLEDIVNNEEICDKGIISYVEILCSPREEVRSLLNDYALDGVIIRDTRGFLDESREKMKEYLEYLEQERPDNKEFRKIKEKETEEDNSLYLQKLMDDRGLYNIDACVFISMAGANALNVKTNREIYGPLLEYMLKTHPVFMVLRDNRLTQKLNEGDTYEMAVECIRTNKYYTGFQAARKLLKDFGLCGNNNDYRANIVQKHYGELMLADIQEENWHEQEEIYKKSTIGVLNGVFKAVREYNTCLEEAERCLEHIEKRYEELQKELFDQYFNEYIVCRGNEYINLIFAYYPQCLAEKVKGIYEGGMVGKWGGLTTWRNHQRVGWAAIDFLETAYWARKILDRKIIDALEPEIEEYVRGFTEAAEIPDAVVKEKQNLILKLQRILYSNFEHLFCTERMLRREYLEIAYDKTREQLDVDDKGIGKCLPELKDVISEDHKEDLSCMSVVKCMLWILITQLNPRNINNIMESAVSAERE